MVQEIEIIRLGNIQLKFFFLIEFNCDADRHRKWKMNFIVTFYIIV